MTYGEPYKQIKQTLEEAGCEFIGFDAECILEDIGGLPHRQRARYLDEIVPEEIREAFRNGWDGLEERLIAAFYVAGQPEE